jgi:hypothetical protein
MTKEQSDKWVEELIAHLGADAATHAPKLIDFLRTGQSQKITPRWIWGLYDKNHSKLNLFIGTRSSASPTAPWETLLTQ